MKWMRFLMTAAVLGCGSVALAGCGSAGGGQPALFAGGTGNFGESPAKPGLYDDQGWPVQPASSKVAPGQDAQGTPTGAR